MSEKWVDAINEMTRPVHKGVKSIIGVYNLCNDKMDGSKWSYFWKKVTCKRCLKKKK